MIPLRRLRLLTGVAMLALAGVLSAHVALTLLAEGREARLTASDPFRADAIDNPPFASLTYGIQAFLWWEGGDEGLHLDWVRLMSFSHVKQTFAWRDIQPEPDLWRFHHGDRLLDQIEARDLKLVARLGQTPDWAAPQGVSTDANEKTDVPPADLDDWRTYCERVATRYRGRIAAYQIWNEPNLSREWGGQAPDPGGYVELLATCSAAIRAADPDAIIISAGLAPTGNDDAIAMRDDRYLRALYAADFQRHIDVVGLHAPGFSAPKLSPDEAEAQGRARWATFRRVEDMRRIMVENGDAARQVALLEVGWTTDPDNPVYSWFAVSEDEQARYLVAAFEYAIAHWRPWVGLMSVIYLTDSDWTPADEEYWWALTTPQRGHRQAFFDLANMRKVCGDIIIPQREPDSPEALGHVPAPLCP